MTENRVKTKNAGVELARIIASLIVIGCHVYPEAIFNASRTLIAMFFADGVTVFWFISGFYLFNNTDYKKMLNHTLKRVVIPTVILLLFSFYFRNWLFGKASFGECFFHSGEEYYDFFHSLVTWNAYGPCGHLWFVFIYLLIILLYPLIRQVVLYIDSNEKYQKRFLVITAILILANDFLHNQLLEFSHHMIGGLVPALIQVIWGHIIFDKIKDTKKISSALWVLVVFTATNVVRFLIGWNEIGEVIGWSSFSGLVSAICILTFSFSVMNNVKNEKFAGTICYIGSITFTVYLIHMLSIGVLNRVKFRPKLEDLTLNSHEGIGPEIIYTLGMILATAVLSIIAAILIERLTFLFRNVLGKKKASLRGGNGDEK